MSKTLKNIGALILGLAAIPLLINLLAALLTPPPSMSDELLTFYIFLMLYYQNY